MEVLVDDDALCLSWLRDHPRGFVLSSGRTPGAAYLVLHRATRPTIGGMPRSGRSSVVAYQKVGGESLAELAELGEWAVEQTGARPSRCGSCAP